MTVRDHYYAVEVFVPSDVDVSEDRIRWYFDHAVRGYHRGFALGADPIRGMARCTVRIKKVPLRTQPPAREDAKACYDCATDRPHRTSEACTHPAPDALRRAVEALPGATYQKSETITLTASGDETCAELKQRMVGALPREFKFAGGLDRIRKGEPVPGTNRLHERDQQAHAAFVAHHPRQALAALKAEQKGGA